MLRRSALALLATALAGPAFAQAYPTKPITLIVPFAAGGPTDLMARIVGERMAKELGQQIVIDNVTGAAGSIAMGKLAHAAPDGYTIGIGHLGTNVVNGLIYKNLNYDLLDDLVPIARLPSNPLLVVTSNQVPAKDLKELVAYLKANADKISGGTAGMGSGSHIGALAFFAVTGTNYQLVPYRGTGPAVQDLIANQIQIMIDQSSNSLPHVRAGKLKVYAVDRQGANGGGARHPDHGRSGLPRHRGRDLARPVGAQGHAAGDHRQAERSGRRRPQGPRDPPQARGSRPGHPDARADAARRLRRLSARRVRQMEADHRQGERQGRMTAGAQA